ncbi:MAG TPA: hypothetical protein VIK89_11715 [Cytophagaceae bacterium]
MVKKLVLLLSICSIPLLAVSQTEKVTRFAEAALSANSYKGDLHSNYQKWTGAFHAGILLNHKYRLNGHFGLMAGTIMGDNADYQFTDNSGNTATPNTFFKTSIIALNYDIHLNLLKKNNYIVYLTQGAGLLRFSPKNELNEELTGQFNTRAKNETYSNITLFFPTGIGAIYLFPNGYGAGFQATYLNTTSDYLDNISQYGHRQKKDNVLSYRFSFYIPISYKSE